MKTALLMVGFVALFASTALAADDPPLVVTPTSIDWNDCVIESCDDDAETVKTNPTVFDTFEKTTESYANANAESYAEKGDPWEVVAIRPDDGAALVPPSTYSERIDFYYSEVYDTRQGAGIGLSVNVIVAFTSGALGQSHS